MVLALTSGAGAAPYMWLDAGWSNGPRDAEGNIVVDPAQWPHGMTWHTGSIHSLGLRAGPYADAGPVGCGKGAAKELIGGLA